MSAPEVRTGNMISAIFSAFARDFADLFRNPLAFTVALLGMSLTGVIMFFGFQAMAEKSKNDAGAEDDDFVIPFDPGALVKLGAEIEEKELPEKIIIQETRAEEEVVQETVTEDEEAKPAEEPPPEPDEKPKKTDKPPPKEKKDKKLPTSKLPTTSNTPYKDLPTVTVPRGDPFGDPGGWSDLKKDGNPWATAVMKAMNNMKVGAYAAKAGAGNFKYQVSVCKDGKIKDVRKKGGTLSADGQNAVRLALEQLKVPAPPPDIAKKMKGSCAKIQYTFNWSASGVK